MLDENNEINSAWKAVAPITKKYNFYDIKDMKGLAGRVIKILKGLGFDDYRQQNTSTDQLVSEIEGQFLKLSKEIKHRF